MGIAHFPVLHRQFSPSASSFSLGSSSSQDLAQDNKDVLIERLNDLVLRISRDGSLEDDTISAIHSHVDHIESAMHATEKFAHSHVGKSSAKFTKQTPKDNEEYFWGQISPLSPSRQVTLQLPASPRRLFQNRAHANTADTMQVRIFGFPFSFRDLLFPRSLWRD